MADTAVEVIVAVAVAVAEDSPVEEVALAQVEAVLIPAVAEVEEPADK